MKYINIKKLLIKFIGGGLINFPTRFLRWIKIDGDLEEDDSGDDSNSNVFFVPATIQPKYFINDDSTEPVEIENYTPPTYGSTFLYNKEDIISLGVNEEDLNNLNIIGINDAFNDFNNDIVNGYMMETFANEKIILFDLDMGNSCIHIYNNIDNPYLYKLSNDVFLILQSSIMPIQDKDIN